jgi:hypothetical protein
MKTIIRATAALALLAATLPALAASATVTRAWQFKPESNAGLAVRNLIGNIRVERGTTPGIHITANTTIEAATQARPSDLRASSTTAARTSARVHFDVRLPHGTSRRSLGKGRVRLVLDNLRRLPRRAHPPGQQQGRGPGRARGPVIRAPVGAKLDVSNIIGDSLAQNFSRKQPRRRQRPRRPGGEGGWGAATAAAK